MSRLAFFTRLLNRVAFLRRSPRPRITNGRPPWRAPESILRIRVKFPISHVSMALA
jgi:hypothetical protein